MTLPRRIHVCHVITTLELGGAQQNTLYTVQHLNPQQFKASLLTGPEGMLHDEARKSGIDHQVIPSLSRTIDPRLDVPALLALTKTLRRMAPDIVHTHSSKAGILGRWAARMAGVKTIVHSVHGFGFHVEQPALLRRALIRAEKLTGRYATDAFIAVSQANLDQGTELGVFCAHPTHKIYSGVKLARFNATAPSNHADTIAHESRGAPNATVNIGMIACLKPQKAPLDFVRVAQAVKDELGDDDPAVRFHLVGDGPLRQSVQQAIHNRSLDDLVELGGWSRNVPGVLHKLDIMLHTARWEGLPRVFPEAMASALPIVATRVDGAPEAIEHDVTGFLADAGDVPALTKYVLQLIRNPQLRRSFGAKARERAGAWDIDAMVRAQERLYQDLAG